MKTINLVAAIFLIILYGCNDCENELKKNREEFFEQHNSAFSILRESKSYNELKEQQGIQYTSTIDDLGKETSILIREFDSIHFYFDSIYLTIDYYHLSHGCSEFIPLVTTSADTAIIKCLKLNTAEIRCVNNKKELVYKVISCINIMKWRIQVKKDKVKDKIIMFEPFENEKYFITK